MTTVSVRRHVQNVIKMASSVVELFAASHGGILVEWELLCGNECLRTRHLCLTDSHGIHMGQSTWPCLDFQPLCSITSMNRDR